MRDSVAAGNSAGIFALETGSGTTNVMIDRSASVNNSNKGIDVSGTVATVRIGDSTVTGNFVGLSTLSSGVIASYGTNKVDGNGTDSAATGMIVMK